MSNFIYLRVKGKLDPSWSVWFDDFEIKYDDYGDTVLSGIVTDNREWIGLLESVHGARIQLVSIFSGDGWPEHDAPQDTKGASGGGA